MWIRSLPPASRPANAMPRKSHRLLLFRRCGYFAAFSFRTGQYRLTKSPIIYEAGAIDAFSLESANLAARFEHEAESSLFLNKKPPTNRLPWGWVIKVSSSFSDSSSSFSSPRLCSSSYPWLPFFFILHLLAFYPSLSRLDRKSSHSSTLSLYTHIPITPSSYSSVDETIETAFDSPSRSLRVSVSSSHLPVDPHPSAFPASPSSCLLSWL